MKKIIIALAVIGLSYTGAEAQTKGAETTTKTCKCHSTTKKVRAKKGIAAHKHVANKANTAETKSNDTYQVCREVGGHYQCCKHNTEVVTTVAK